MIAPKMPSRSLDICDVSTRIVPVQKAFSLITRRSTKTDGPLVVRGAVSAGQIRFPIPLICVGDPRQGGSPLSFWLLALSSPVRGGGGAVVRGSRWSARSAARTNDLDAGADPTAYSRSGWTRRKVLRLKS